MKTSKEHSTQAAPKAGSQPAAPAQPTLAQQLGNAGLLRILQAKLTVERPAGPRPRASEDQGHPGRGASGAGQAETRCRSRRARIAVPLRRQVPALPRGRAADSNQADDQRAGRSVRTGSRSRGGSRAAHARPGDLERGARPARRIDPAQVRAVRRGGTASSPAARQRARAAAHLGAHRLARVAAPCAGERRRGCDGCPAPRGRHSSGARRRHAAPVCHARIPRTTLRARPDRHPDSHGPVVGRRRAASPGPSLCRRLRPLLCARRVRPRDLRWPAHADPRAHALDSAGRSAGRGHSAGNAARRQRRPRRRGAARGRGRADLEGRRGSGEDQTNRGLNRGQGQDCRDAAVRRPLARVQSRSAWQGRTDQRVRLHLSMRLDRPRTFLHHGRRGLCGGAAPGRCQTAQAARAAP